MMDSRRWSILLALSSLLATSAFADGPAGWQLLPGQQFDHQISQETVARWTQGNEPDRTQRDVVDSRWVVDRVDDEGTMHVRVKVKRVRMRLGGRGHVVADIDTSFDQELDAFARRFAPTMRTLARSELSIALGPRGDLTHVILPEELVGELDIEPAGGFLSREGLLALLRQGIPRLPDTPLTLADTWTIERRLPLPPQLSPHLARLVIDETYSYKERSANGDAQSHQFEIAGELRAGDFIGADNIPTAIQLQEYVGEMRFAQEGYPAYLTVRQRLFVMSGDLAVHGDQVTTIKMTEVLGTRTESSVR